MQKKHTILTVVKAAHENDDDNRSTDEETAGSLAPTFTADECTDRKLQYINAPNKNPPTGVLTKSTNIIHAERYFNLCPG